MTHCSFSEHCYASCGFVTSNIAFFHRASSLGPHHASHHHWYRPIPKHPLHAFEWNPSSRKILVSKRKTRKSNLNANRTWVIQVKTVFCLDQVQQDRRRFLRSDGSLYIEKAIPQDAGTYICTAENVAGSANITVSLEVQGMRAIQSKEIFFLSRFLFGNPQN